MTIKQRLLTAAELQRKVFGSPSAWTGDAISMNEVSKAMYKNPEIRKQLSEETYQRVMNDVQGVKPEWANYGCYGTGDDEEYFVVEVYKFDNINHADESLFVVIAKQFTCEVVDDDGDVTADDILLDYPHAVLSTWFIGSYVQAMSMNKVVFDDKTIQLVKDVPMNTLPNEFYFNRVLAEQ